MPGMRRRVSLGLLLGLLGYGLADVRADSWCSPVYVYPAWPWAYQSWGPLILAPQLPYATPAPPSSPSKRPPDKMPLADSIPEKKAEQKTSSAGPTVSESRSSASSPASATGTAKERCRVGFWNISGRDITLTIDGSARSLPRDRALTLELPRSFVWQVDRGPERTERIADGDATHEVVIRQ